MSENYNAAVVGLGSMGFGMAQSLVNSGINTYGYDISQQRVTDFVAGGGKSDELTQIAASLDCLILVVVNAAQTSAVLQKDKLLANLKKDAVVVSCATVPPTFAKEMESMCKEQGLHYLDAPISGGSIKAANGQITVLAAGTGLAFEAAKPALDAMAEKVFQLGDSAGPGSAMKSVNQLLAGVHIAAAAEAITFGLSQGVDAKTTVEVISQCAGTSWMFENRGPHIADGDYTPHSAVDIFVKDLGIVCDIGHASKFPLPLSATALQQFLAAAGSGLGREDDSAVAKVYARNGGVQLPEA